MLLKKIMCFVFLAVFFSCSNMGKGTKNNPLTLFFLPAGEDKHIISNAIRLTDFLTEKTGFYFMPVFPVSYSDVIFSLDNSMADAAFMESIAYVSAEKKVGLDPVLKFLHGGRSAYRGELLVSSKSRLKEYKDIQGKRIVYTDRFSASGYIFPKALLNELNILPAGETLTENDMTSVRLLLENQADVACVSENAQLSLKRRFPDIEKKVRVLGFTEFIPNEVLCFRKSISTKMKTKITSEIADYIKTDEGAAVMKSLFDIDGFTIVSDEDYDVVRKAMKKAGDDEEYNPYAEIE